MAAVKIGVSRQVVIPKKIHDTLGLAPGDYLEVAVERGKVVMTPKALVDKRFEKRLAESFEDFRKGRTYGPFSSAKEAIEALDAPKKRKKAKACACAGNRSPGQSITPERRRSYEVAVRGRGS
jgi:AbrB family looped-hinge helix DNA binding protein